MGEAEAIQVKHDSCKHVYFWLVWGLTNIWSHVTDMTYDCVTTHHSGGVFAAALEA